MTHDPAVQAKENLRTLARLETVASGRVCPNKPARHMHTLKRRMDFLDAQIVAHRGSPDSIAYTIAEHDALAWALAELARTRQSQPQLAPADAVVPLPMAA